MKGGIRSKIHIYIFLTKITEQTVNTFVEQYLQNNNNVISKWQYGQQK